MFVFSHQLAITNVHYVRFYLFYFFINNTKNMVLLDSNNCMEADDLPELWVLLLLIIIHSYKTRHVFLYK